MQPIIVSGAAEYSVFPKQIGEFQGFNVHVCRTADGTELLFKIAKDKTQNGLLDREALILRMLEEEMKQRDDAYKRATGAEHGHGYRRSIPKLIETKVLTEHNDRRANVLSIYGADAVTDLVPLQQWRTREQVRIDPKSSAWIMGRLLKILTLTQPFGVVIGGINGENILINPAKHHVTFFDWTTAMLLTTALPKEDSAREIALCAREVIKALGGNLQQRTLPQSDQLSDNRYADLLFSFAFRQVSDPIEAGRVFYELLDQLWESGFHPFTTHPMKGH